MQLISEHIAELVPPLLEGLAVTLEIMAGAVVLAVPLLRPPAASLRTGKHASFSNS